VTVFIYRNPTRIHSIPVKISGIGFLMQRKKVSDRKSKNICSGSWRRGM
jgi:hypothetical protein